MTRHFATAGALAALLFADVAVAQTVLQRGNGAAPGTLDPQRATTAAEFRILYDLYEGLITYDPAGNIVPGAAVEWAISDDRLIYTFTMRETAWSDGSAVTAADFVRAFERLFDPAVAAPDADLFRRIEGADDALGDGGGIDDIGVVAVDEQTLQITLAEPEPLLLHLLALPAAMPVHADAPNTATLPQPTTPFNGAYRFDGSVAGRGVWLIANDDFHAAETVAFGTVVYDDAPADVALDAFAEGTLHIASAVPAFLIPTLVETYPEELRVAPFAGSYFLAANVDGVLADPSLRLAAALAVDRIALAEEVWSGLTLPTLQLVPDGVADLPPPAEAPLGPNDPDARLAEAAALLAEAGVTEQNPLELTLAVATGGVSAATGAAIAADLEALAIDVTIVERSPAEHNQDLLGERTFDLATVGWIGRVGHAEEFLGLFREGPFDITGYRNEEVDALLAEARVTADRAVRTALYGVADNRIAGDLPAIPLLQFESFNLVSSGIVGWTDNPLDVHLSRWLVPALAEEEAAE